MCYCKHKKYARKNINIDINSVESIINGAVSDIGAVQDDINKIYSDLNKCLSEAFGDEADALREQLTVEGALATALCNTLKKFSESIQFAASEFIELDTTGASQMGKK